MAIPQKTDINPETGKQYAVNPSSGVWDDNYWATVVEPRLIASNPEAQMQRQAQLAREAVQPAVSSLEASIPETQKLYATERERLSSQKEPLIQRYENLISEITQRETKNVNQQTLTTANELARRGISNQSGFAQQEMTSAVNPIREAFAGLLKDTTFQREEQLKSIDDLITSLVGQESSAVRDIKNTIGQILASAGTGGLQNALQLLANQQQQRQFEQQLAQQSLMQSIENAFREKTYETIDLPQSQAQVSRLLQLAGGGGGTVGGGGSSIEDLWREFQGSVGGGTPSGRTSSAWVSG